MRRWVAVALASVVAGSLLGTAPTAATPRGTRVQVFKRGLNFAVDMAWVPGTKRIFFTEKSGRIRILQGRTLKSTPCRRLKVNSQGERGLLGIVLHPNYEENHFLYVFYTKASPLQNRVARFTVRNNRCRDPKLIVRNLPTTSSGYHNGGQLTFAHGKLFVSVGEDHQPSLAQSKSSRLGKILRVNPNGTIPGGNPFGNAVWSYGHRNPFGLAVRPGTSQVYETENGPSCDDEVNRIYKGRNYGWGAGYTCDDPVGPNPVRPLWDFSSIVVPTDAWWYRGRMRSLSGSLYVGDFKFGRLHRFLLNSRGTRVRGHRIVTDISEGIVDVSKGPGEWLYFVTPTRILRIVPA